jgi:hypothetical protein
VVPLVELRERRRYLQVCLQKAPEIYLIKDVTGKEMRPNH